MIVYLSGEGRRYSPEESLAIANIMLSFDKLRGFERE